MEINKVALLERVGNATFVADQMLKRLKELSSMEKAQKLFDISSFDCNKHIVLELFNALAGTNYKAEDFLLSSERRFDVLFPLGTIVRIHYNNDMHNYPVGSLAMIARHYKEGPRNKTYMQALKEDGTLGNALYFYGIDSFRAFLPAPEATEQFVKLHVPHSTDNPTILRAVSLVLKGEDYGRE